MKNVINNDHPQLVQAANLPYEEAKKAIAEGRGYRSDNILAGKAYQITSYERGFVSFPKALGGATGCPVPWGLIFIFEK